MFVLWLQILKRVEVYDSRQLASGAELRKFEGELKIKTNFTGSEITLTGKWSSALHCYLFPFVPPTTD